MLLKTQEYHYQVTHRPGSSRITSGCLSRAPVRSRADHSETVCNLLYTPFNDHRLQEIKAAFLLDPVLNQLKITILQGWPDHKDSVPAAVLTYFGYRKELTVQNGIILRSDKIVIPQSLRQDLKIKAHAGHQGINYCLRRTRGLIFLSRHVGRHSRPMWNLATHAQRAVLNNLNKHYRCMKFLRDHGKRSAQICSQLKEQTTWST